jgi:hypothetical protein
MMKLEKNLFRQETLSGTAPINGRRRLASVCNPYSYSIQIWVNTTIDLRTGKAVSAYVARLSDRPHVKNNQMGQNAGHRVPPDRFDR